MPDLISERTLKHASSIHTAALVCSTFLPWPYGSLGQLRRDLTRLQTALSRAARDVQTRAGSLEIEAEGVLKARDASDANW